MVPLGHCEALLQYLTKVYLIITLPAEEGRLGIGGAGQTYLQKMALISVYSYLVLFLPLWQIASILAGP
jgi:hypothetical protein